MDLGADDLAGRILQRHARLKSNRGNWETHWEEVASRVMPNYSSSFIGANAPGTKRNQEMFDATAAMACTKFAAAMESMLTPRNQRWHRLIAMDKTLNRNRQAREWFEDVTDILFRMRYAPQANFASNQHEIYMGLGAFGTGCMFTDALKDRNGKTVGTRYRAIHLGEIQFAENHQGIIDTAIRKFTYTVRQAMQAFGKDALGPKLVEQAEANPDREFEFLHCVMPREDFAPGRLDAKGMEFASYYICTTDKKVVQESGYHTFPYSISRYVLAPGEIYGRSPAMLALPDIKVLNEINKTTLKAGHRVVDPVLLAHDDGVLDSFSLKPGAINYGGVSADGRPLVHALPTGNLAFAKELTAEKRESINDAFLVTLFQILVDTPQMTATEVLERAREKGALLSPTMGRQQSEGLGPLIHRELDILARAGLLPPLPPVLKSAMGADYDVVYDSPLSRAQRAEEAAGTMRTVEFAVNIAAQTQDPSVLDNFNWDVIVPEVADINGMPIKYLNTMDKIMQLRQGRDQDKQAAQITQALPGAAAMMKVAGTNGQQ
jgi:hypothetical protein